jgi:very-short-patch-repair endonuclease
MLAGWSIGQESCALWEHVAKLCQTEAERKFLHWYLGLVRDRQFPMLIPQTRIGIAERRRPDFVLFVPLQYWSYKWYAIELDKAHPKGVLELADGVRNSDVAKHGYEVISLRPENQGYLQEVKTLVEKIERDLSEVENDPWSVGVEAEVKSTFKSEQAPF